MELDVTVQIPSLTPFVNLSFAYSNIYIDKFLSSDVDQFDVTTYSGSVVCNSSSFHSNDSNIHVSKGSIQGRYTLGKTLFLNSASGINVDIAVDPSIDSSNATFHTSTSSGFTNVHFLGPLRHRNQIASTHESYSGKMHVSYPLEWEGVVEGSTGSGSLMLKGDGLEIVERKGMRYEKAVKGDDWENKGTVNVSTFEGSLVFELGGKF